MAIESAGDLTGMPLPERSLPDADGVMVALREAEAKATLVAFVCNHCPYVQHVERVFGQVVARHETAGLRTVAVVSNDFEAYPDDDVPGVRAQIARAGWGFHYLIDRDQSLALELGAVCTPDFFLFDAGFELAYRGAFDVSSPKNGNPVSGDLLDGAITSALAGHEVPLPHRPAMGCGIKWLSGNEPEAH
jgi:thiol-disulfide isomerase/thioredoxin